MPNFILIEEKSRCHILNSSGDGTGVFTIIINAESRNTNGTAYYTLKNVARIHNLLIPQVSKVIIHGLVINKLDYCNGHQNHQLNKLQIVQIWVVE